MKFTIGKNILLENLSNVELERMIYLGYET